MAVSKDLLFLVHYAERKPGTLYTGCGQALVQGISSSSVVEEVTCWQCRFKLDTTKERKGRGRKKKVAEATATRTSS